MGYEDVQKLHEKELLAMGISQDEAKEIMTAEEEYGVSFRDTRTGQSVSYPSDAR